MDGIHVLSGFPGQLGRNGTTIGELMRAHFVDDSWPSASALILRVQQSPGDVLNWNDVNVRFPSKAAYLSKDSSIMFLRACVRVCIRSPTCLRVCARVHFGDFVFLCVILSVRVCWVSYCCVSVREVELGFICS